MLVLLKNEYEGLSNPDKKRMETRSGMRREDIESFLKNEEKAQSKIPSPKKAVRHNKPVRYELDIGVGSKVIEERKLDKQFGSISSID
jgi:hypothetical protein